MNYGRHTFDALERDAAEREDLILRGREERAANKVTADDLDREIAQHEEARALFEHLERSPAPRIPRIPRSGPVVIPLRTGWIRGWA